MTTMNREDKSPYSIETFEADQIHYQEEVGRGMQKEIPVKKRREQ